jgi:hypothetical protein
VSEFHQRGVHSRLTGVLGQWRDRLSIAGRVRAWRRVGYAMGTQRRGIQRRLMVSGVAAALLTSLVLAPAVRAATPLAVSSFTPADVNAAVASGVAYIDAAQNADGSFGVNFPAAETAFAIISYGVLDDGDYHNLSAAMQLHLQNAVTYLVSQQNADGSFGSFYQTYTTGLALDGLSLSTGVVPGIPTAMGSGRTYLISTQNAPPAVTGNPLSPDCSTDDQPPAGSGSDTYCGGWNYEADFGRSDESNTGFALTGLALSGGVPAATASFNVGWQRHVQELTATNYFAQRNDGGGDYEPGVSFGDFSSNANNTGSLLFGFGYDGVAGSDPKVQAALTFATDVLDEYELMKATVRSMVHHTGMNEDGTCVIGALGCDWEVGFDGGYHYSLWSLTKGFGHYIAPDLSNPTNWYAKVVDLLLTEQSSNGSWPVDGRDDASDIVATSFAVDALGLVGVPTHALTVTKSGAGSGTVTSSPTGIDCGFTCSASFSQGTMVTLTASAAVGSTFAGWGGACTGTGSCVVTLDQDRSVTATFDMVASTQTLSVTTTGSGSGTVTSSPSGINCGVACSAAFTQGTIVTLSASAAAGSTFTGWGGACTGTGSCTVTMDQDRSVTATFNTIAGLKSTSTTYTGGSSVQYSDAVTLSGTLLDTSVTPNIGVAGKQLDFTLGTQTTSAGPTDVAGNAATSLVVTQQPGSVTTVATAFAGDTIYAASNDSDPFAIAKEDCTVAYTGDTLVNPANMTNLSAQFGELDATQGDWTGKSITFTVTDAALSVQTFNATTNAAGVASTTAPLGPGVYGVGVSFAGDDFYLPCASATDTLVTVGAPNAKITGGGWISQTGKTSFGFNVIQDVTGLRGQLQVRVRSGKDRFHSTSVLTFNSSGSSGTWTGTGRWNGIDGYSFTVSVVDNGTTGKNGDTISLVITSPSNVTVFSTTGAQPLKGGNIVVH